MNICGTLLNAALGMVWSRRQLGAPRSWASREANAPARVVAELLKQHRAAARGDQRGRLVTAVPVGCGLKSAFAAAVKRARVIGGFNRTP